MTLQGQRYHYRTTSSVEFQSKLINKWLISKIILVIMRGNVHSVSFIMTKKKLVRLLMGVSLLRLNSLLTEASLFLLTLNHKRSVKYAKTGKLLNCFRLYSFMLAKKITEALGMIQTMRNFTGFQESHHMIQNARVYIYLTSKHQNKSYIFRHRLTSPITRKQQHPKLLEIRLLWSTSCA